ncbi:MAG: hypothetical protein OER90_20245 [Gemmatimonadota bacterium]|nr:hypothetical protein [Gemmatimonadota bacterium]
MKVPLHRFVIAVCVSPLVALTAVLLLVNIRDRVWAISVDPPPSVLQLLRLHFTLIANEASWAYQITALLAVPSYWLVTRRVPTRLLPTLLVSIVAAVAAYSLRFHPTLELLYVGCVAGLAGGLTYWYLTASARLARGAAV